MKLLTSETSFQALLDQPIALILFKSHGCSVCEAVSVQLDERIAAYPTLPHGAIYADDFPTLRGQHMIFTAPVVLLFVEGKEVYRSARFIDFRRLMKTLNHYFSSLPHHDR